ncbi:MAG: hypothetical protein V1885_03390 [Candidatus Brennerbacteria bacterium]
MKQETRDCQNCKQPFVIEAEDFSFYEKMTVPAPTWCPKCRLQRRLAFFNLFNLWKRKCDLCGNEMIAMYPPEASYKVYCPHCWWGDGWDPYNYGREYDFSRPFFAQFSELWHEVPLLGLSLSLNSIDTSPYNNHAGGLKNCYLLFHADFCEDSAYGAYLNRCKSVFDSSLTISSEHCYDMLHSYRNNRCVGGRSQVTESIDCAFLKDSMNCQHCFASANMRNKKYYIFNQPYSKEGYEEEMKKWDLGSYRTYQEAKRRAEEHLVTLPPKPTMDEFTTNCTGSHVFQAKNCKDCFEVVGAEDCRYVHMVQDPPVKDCYDVTSWGNNTQRCYEGCVVGEFVSDLKFCQESGINLYFAEYCKLSTGGSRHFGCVSVKKGEYAILNKHYSKEEYRALTEKIRKHMDEMPYVDKRGGVYKYGEFFPVELSPFAYNKTIADIFFPLSKREAEERGYVYMEPEVRTYTVTKQAKNLPDHIKDAPNDIVKETIACEKCGKGYKVTEMELAFLRNMNLPLPRRCPFCRIQEKFAQWVKNLRVIDRTCGKCGVTFQTNYPKEEAPHILCKRCYLKEIV